MLDDDDVSFFMWDFPNDAAFKFDVVSVALSVCVILSLVSSKCPEFCKCLRFSKSGVCHIFEFCWPSKLTSTRSNQPMECEDDGINK